MFDPANYRTVLEIQRAQLGPSSKPQGSAEFPAPQSAKLPKADDPSKQNGGKKNQNAKPVPRNAPASAAPAKLEQAPAIAGSMDELRQRLRYRHPNVIHARVDVFVSHDPSCRALGT